MTADDFEDDALPVGFLLGHFRIDEVLGDGGFGVTYRAWNLELLEPVAIKEYYPIEFARRRANIHSISARSTKDANTFEWGLERFLEEARTLAALQHRKLRSPNIVGVRDHFEYLGTAYMVQDFVEGKPLSEYLDAQQRIPEAQLTAWLDGVLNGLSIVHELGMIHRDLTPSNIIIESDNTPVLIDFGSARSLMSSRSQLHDRVYKQAYAPIEQSSTDASRQGPWTDIYSLAVVLYRAVTGALPPEAPDRIEHDACVPAAEAAKGEYAASFLAAIDHGLNVLAGGRPQSVAAWRAEMFDAASDVPAVPDVIENVPPTQETGALQPEPAVAAPQSSPAPKPNRRLGTFLLVVLVVLVMGVGAGVGITKFGGGDAVVSLEPGMYLTVDVRAGQHPSADIVKHVAGVVAVPGNRPMTMSELRGSCFSRDMPRDTHLAWADFSIGC